MLKKALIIGLGGSGGKTVRIVRQELQERLRRLETPLSLPRGWQFLHIDVPPVADGNEPSLPPQLPLEQYIGLSSRATRYSSVVNEVWLNEMLASSTAPWLPDPIEGNEVNLQAGAGQYRAIGRALFHFARMRVKDTIKSRIDAMTSEVAQQDMMTVTQALAPTLVETGVGDPTAGQPLVVVVSSIAGGSGAGMYLDVCDFVRAQMPSDWGEHLVAVLYAPDTFSNLKGATKNGVQGNALASLSEFINASLSGGASDASESAILSVSGFDRSLDARGPSETFVVGRANGYLKFNDPNSVFFSAGRAIATWIADVKVQSALSTGPIGNWKSNSTTSDSTRLSKTHASKLSSFGYASVDLGRARFADYATDRLAGKAIQILLDAHLGYEFLADQTDDEKIRQLALADFKEFKRRAELQEEGSRDNEIAAAIARKEAEASRRRKTEFEQKIKQRSEMTAENLVTTINQRLSEQQGDWMSEVQANYRAATALWSQDIQSKILEATSWIIGRHGLRVGTAVISMVIEELLNPVLAEFRMHADDEAKLFRETDWIRKIRELFQDAKEKISTNEKRTAAAISAGFAAIESSWNAELFRASGVAVQSLCSNFLEPLKAALDRAARDLRSQATGVVGKQSDVERWQDAGREIPDWVKPPANQLLIMDWESFPSEYQRLVEEVEGGPGWRDGEQRAAEKAIFGATRKDNHPWFRLERGWTTSEDVVGQASFRLNFDAQQIHDRARAWVEDPETTIGKYVGQSLKSFLNPDPSSKVDSEEIKRRLNTFEQRFADALGVAVPLVELDRDLLGVVHGEKGAAAETPTPVFSEIPFSLSHPARERVMRVLASRRLSVEEDGFGEGTTQRIEVSTFFSGSLNPIVFRSLTQPISESLTLLRSGEGLGEFWKWRRARQLPGALPVSLDQRRAMIRGWWIARMMGHLQIGDGGRSGLLAGTTPKIWRDGSWVPFPRPWLGGGPLVAAEVLPAVLETLSEALIDAAAARTLVPLQPYHRLLDLGEAAARDGEAPSALPPEFYAWLRDGASPEHAAYVPATLAEASPDRRGEEAAEYLKSVRKGYQDRLTNHQPRTGEIRRVPPDLEIAHDLELVLARLEKECRAPFGESDSGGPEF